MSGSSSHIRNSISLWYSRNLIWQLSSGVPLSTEWTTEDVLFRRESMNSMWHANRIRFAATRRWIQFIQMEKLWKCKTDVPSNMDRRIGAKRAKHGNGYVKPVRLKPGVVRVTVDIRHAQRITSVRNAIVISQQQQQQHSHRKYRFPFGRKFSNWISVTLDVLMRIFVTS